MSAPSPQVIASMRHAQSAGWFYIPYEAIGTDAQRAAEIKRLTLKPKYADKDDVPIRMFKDLPDEGYLGVPRTYGKMRWAWLPVDDQETDGEPMIDPTVRLPDPRHPAVKEPELQAKFMEDMWAATQTHKSFTATATTGSGKTVVASRNAALVRRKVAILLPLERLLDQWRRELMDKLGVAEHRIGIVQSDTCQWRERDYVLCMMPSLGGRRYPAEFYASIGQVYADECHRLGTPSLALTAALFPARIRIALSATPDRPDGSSQPVFWHFGPIQVSSQASAVDCDVYVHRYDDGGRMAALPRLIRRPGEKKKSEHGFRIKHLTNDERRNRKLAHLVWRLWKAGQQVLAIGEHVRHVQRVMELCRALGIPAEDMGQCTAERHIYQERIHDGQLQRRLLRKEKISAEEFDRAKRTAKVVFATYGCFKEGIDEPRLDAGVDLTPTSKAKQVIGRVRRPYEGKTRSIWITTVDTGDWMSLRYWGSRLRDYRADPHVRVIEGKL